MADNVAIRLQKIENENDILKVGIAGYGIVGQRRRICVDSHSNLHLVAVCDRIFDTIMEFLQME